MCQQIGIPSIDPIERVPLLPAVISYSNWFEWFLSFNMYEKIQRFFCLSYVRMLVFAVLLLIRCSNCWLRSQCVHISDRVNKFELSCGHLLFTSTISTFKLPFGRPIDAIHIRSDSSDCLVQIRKVVRTLFWLRLIACSARALALCLKVNGRTQWIEHQTQDVPTQKAHKRSNVRPHICIFALKINHFHKTDFQSFVVLVCARARHPLETQFIYRLTCRRGGRHLQYNFQKHKHRIYGWLIEL